MPILVGPSALWPTQPKFWVGHGPPGPRCSAPMYCMRTLFVVSLLCTVTRGRGYRVWWLTADEQCHVTLRDCVWCWHCTVRRSPWRRLRHCCGCWDRWMDCSLQQDVNPDIHCSRRIHHYRGTHARTDRRAQADHCGNSAVFSASRLLHKLHRVCRQIIFPKFLRFCILCFTFC